jgi:ADP-L-glycero-D-manno-heptose 6-epimerase
MIIVTGAGGFIGSNLVQGLEAWGAQDIVVVDDFGISDKWKNIAKRSLFDVILTNDFFDYLQDYRGQIDAIFHMGAISSTAETNVDKIILNNINLTLRLFDYCANEGIRFYYGSSASVYGDGAYGFHDQATDKPYCPLNPYAWSKLSVDKAILQRSNSPKDPTPPQWVGLRFFNVYGPNEYHKGAQMSVIPQFLRHILATGHAKLFKSYRNDVEHGEQKRDFVYVKDCVKFMLWLLEREGISGVYNVGTGRARSFSDLATSVFKAVDKPVSIDFVDMPDALRPHYQYFTQADMSIVTKLGYDTSWTSIEEGVYDYVRHHLLQSDPFL